MYATYVHSKSGNDLEVKVLGVDLVPICLESKRVKLARVQFVDTDRETYGPPWHIQEELLTLVD